ncbi:geraniol dehydrogenase [Streptomyces sp. NBRC 110611]|nr:geraniol dehydrogenase [Streptomyces sp. NBRC 110611]
MNKRGIEADGPNGVLVQLQAAGVITDDVAHLVGEDVVLMKGGCPFLVEEEIGVRCLEPDPAGGIYQPQCAQGLEDDRSTPQVRYGIAKVAGGEAMWEPKGSNALFAHGAELLRIQGHS